MHGALDATSRCACSPPIALSARAGYAPLRTPVPRSTMSAQMLWVLLGVGAGPSRTAWSGSSHEWHTIQIGPGSVTCRSSRWRSPQSSQVMVTRIAFAGWHPRGDGPHVRQSPAGYRAATERRHHRIGASATLPGFAIGMDARARSFEPPQRQFRGPRPQRSNGPHQPQVNPGDPFPPSCPSRGAIGKKSKEKRGLDPGS
jgi:hypothetical protein